MIEVISPFVSDIGRKPQCGANLSMVECLQCPAWAFSKHGDQVQEQASPQTQDVEAASLLRLSAGNWYGITSALLCCQTSSCQAVRELRFKGQGRGT